MTEKYFVASASETPDKIFFNGYDAFASKILYLDSFDEKGDKVRSLKYDDETNQYTEDF